MKKQIPSKLPTLINWDVDNCDLFIIFIGISSAEKHYEQAIDLYTNAVELDPTVAVYYGNRSIAYLKTESYGYALIDASRALELDPAYIKVGEHYYTLFTLIFSYSPL